jgi:ComF family protein
MMRNFPFFTELFSGPAADQTKSSRPAMFPGRCLLCGQSALRMTFPVANLCQGCFRALPWLDTSCYHCGIPLPSTGSTDNRDLTCGECQLNHPPFNHVRIPLLYQQPIDTLISQFKYQGNLAAGKTLGELLLKQLEPDSATFDRSSSGPQAIIPVPASSLRLRYRGFNQADSLARVICNRLDLPCLNRLVHRKHRAPQQTLERHQRHVNLKNAFEMRQQYPHINRVAIVDDVITTGATVRQLAILLRQAGFSTIEVWALARTGRYGSV